MKLPPIVLRIPLPRIFPIRKLYRKMGGTYKHNTLGIRMTEQEEALLMQCAALIGTTKSNFVHWAAVQMATKLMDLRGQGMFNPDDYFDHLQLENKDGRRNGAHD